MHVPFNSRWQPFDAFGFASVAILVSVAMAAGYLVAGYLAVH